ncbi:MAG: GntR family transcriptional regulator [Planctomycetota bacterium]|jgi:GntR family transcriptional regulator
MIPETTGLPKYYQISQDIIGMIRCGKLKPGMQIPSENEIIQQYNVSNTTARRSLQEIESAGWAARIKGKGTFVRDQNIQRSATRILGFSRNMVEAGHTPSTKVLDARKVMEGHSGSINGRRYVMEGPVYKIHRLRFADDIPMMIEVRYISARFCPDIERHDFTGSLYEIYEKHYDLSLAEIRQTLSTVMIDAGTQRFFDVREPIPAFRVEGVTFCGKEMILEMEETNTGSLSERPSTL